MNTPQLQRQRRRRRRHCDEVVMELSLSVDVGSVICIWQRPEGEGEGGRTSSCDGGVWEPQHFGALNGAASAARDLQRPPRYHNLFGHHVSREGPRRAHVLGEIINGYNHELSQAPSRSCAPWPTVPHSPPLSLFLSVAWTFFHMQLQLISTA